MSFQEIENLSKTDLKNKQRMYFVCTDYDVVFGQGDISGVDNIDNFYILGTPFLVKIMEYTVTEYYAGTKAILDFLNK